MSHCKYCNRYLSTRKVGIEHIEKMHADKLEEEGLTVTQALWLGDHDTLTGRCTCCPTCKEITGWCDKTGKPYRISTNPACRARVAAQAERNLAGVGKDKHTMMSDMEHQREMLRNRKTSGKYKFQDGQTVDYSSQLELNWLMFCDKVLDLKSYMIQEPPESFTYHDPKTNTDRQYSPDYYLPDYNLLVEIKDGGDKPNGNPAYLEETRYKVYLKDEVMKAQKKYNFIRISGKNYGAFMEALFTIVSKDLNQIPTNSQRHETLCVITESAVADEPQIPVDKSYPNISNIVLAVKYIGFTDMVQAVAITDSTYQSYWYLSLYKAGVLERVDAEEFDAIVGTTRYFRYIGSEERMDIAYKNIMETAESSNAMHYWSILMILKFAGIYFDAGGDCNNNVERRSDFVEYRMVDGEGRECIV